MQSTSSITLSTTPFTALFNSGILTYESKKDYDIFETIISNFDSLDYEVKILFVTFATGPSEINNPTDRIVQIIDPTFNDDRIDLTSEYLPINTGSI